MNGLEIVGAITLTVLATVIVIITIVFLVRVIIAKKALREREKSDERVYKSLLSEINKAIPNSFLLCITNSNEEVVKLCEKYNISINILC